MSAGLRDIPDLGWSVSDAFVQIVLVGMMVWLLPAWVLALLAWGACSVAVAVLFGRVAQFGEGEE
jgi:hypothetical protein